MFAFLIVVQVAGGAPAQSQAPLIKEAGFEITSIADSGSYLLYRYRLVNSAQSRSGIAGINLNLSAPAGTGLILLPSSGRMINGAAIAVGPVTDHVPVGIVSPDGWTSAVMPNAIITWYPFLGYASGKDGLAVPITGDSAPPGSAKAGFGLRSPYLPGLRRFAAEPTLGACCAHPKPGSGEYPAQGEFRARGSTVAPTVRPESISVAIVQSDLEQLCGPLRWIPDVAACQRYSSALDDAAAAVSRGDTSTVKRALTTFLDALNNHHGAGGPVSDNAYWLLKVNVEYLIAHTS